MLRFNVFGRIIGVSRRGDEWRVVEIGPEGKHRESSDVVIPASVPESELARYLADLFHESASPANPEVLRVDH